MSNCKHEWVDLIFFSKEKYKTCKKCGIAWEEQEKDKPKLIVSSDKLIDEAFRNLILNQYASMGHFINDLIYTASLHGREFESICISPGREQQVTSGVTLTISGRVGLIRTYRGIRIEVEPQFRDNDWDYKLKPIVNT